MKYLKYFLVVSVFITSVSFNTTRTSRISESIYTGNLFPDIENLEDTSGTKVNLSDLRGQKVLVMFWAAYDANSHKENVLFSNVIKKNNIPVKLVSVSFDKSQSIFERTLSYDEIDLENQFLANKENYKKLFVQHQLDRGFKNYLIDENGVTIAEDLKIDALREMLSEV